MSIVITPASASSGSGGNFVTPNEMVCYQIETNTSPPYGLMDYSPIHGQTSADYSNVNTDFWAQFIKVGDWVDYANHEVGAYKTVVNISGSKAGIFGGVVGPQPSGLEPATFKITVDGTEYEITAPTPTTYYARSALGTIIAATGSGYGANFPYMSASTGITYTSEFVGSPEQMQVVDPYLVSPLFALLDGRPVVKFEESLKVEMKQATNRFFNTMANWGATWCYFNNG